MYTLTDVTLVCAMQKSLHEEARLQVVPKLPAPAVRLLTLLAGRHHQTQTRLTNYQVGCESRHTPVTVLCG